MKKHKLIILFLASIVKIVAAVIVLCLGTVSVWAETSIEIDEELYSPDDYSEDLTDLSSIDVYDEEDVVIDPFEEDTEEVTVMDSPEEFYEETAEEHIEERSTFFYVADEEKTVSVSLDVVDALPVSSKLIVNDITGNMQYVWELLENYFSPLKRKVIDYRIYDIHLDASPELDEAVIMPSLPVKIVIELFQSDYYQNGGISDLTGLSVFHVDHPEMFSLEEDPFSSVDDYETSTLISFSLSQSLSTMCILCRTENIEEAIEISEAEINSDSTLSAKNEVFSEEANNDKNEEVLFEDINEMEDYSDVEYENETPDVTLEMYASDDNKKFITNDTDETSEINDEKTEEETSEENNGEQLFNDSTFIEDKSGNIDEYGTETITVELYDVPADNELITNEIADETTVAIAEEIADETDPVTAKLITETNVGKIDETSNPTDIAGGSENIENTETLSVDNEIIIDDIINEYENEQKTEYGDESVFDDLPADTESIIENFFEWEESTYYGLPEDSDTLMMEYFNAGVNDFGVAGNDTEYIYSLYSSNYNGDKLENYNGNPFTKTIYDGVKKLAEDVAAGVRTNTVYTLHLSEEMLSGYSWTAADLGLGSLTTTVDNQKTIVDDAVKIAVQSLFDKNLAVHSAIRDCPYEMYWFGNTIKYGTSQNASVAIVNNVEKLHIDSLDLTVKLKVSVDYAAANNEYVTNLATMTGISAAINNANEIVTSASGYDNLGKLTYFRDRLRALSGYNQAAASSTGYYGNPWQIIYLFDGNPETTVVCEGYSKGFQYLCDKSQFTGQFATYCVAGFFYADGQSGVGHMWNIVHMNGKNYLVDITNYRANEAENKNVFMALPVDGSVDDTYVFLIGEGRYNYQYYYDTRDIYSNSELVMDYYHEYNSEGICIYCGMNKDSECNSPYGHSYESKVIKQSTCKEKGSRQYTCIFCQKTYQESIPITDHKPVTDKAVASTCTLAGKTAGSHCSVCGKVITPQKSIAALGHSWNAGEVTKIPSFSVTGVKTYTCTRCGAKRTETIPVIKTTGWQQIGGKWYYFNSSGAMTTGWQQIGGKWYYMNSSGAMTTGWQQIGGKWYYMNSSGAMTTGWQQIGGKKYYFSSSGAWVSQNG